MPFRTFLRLLFITLIAVGFIGLHPAYTAASNARIIRLSLVQGDVRILHDSKGDPLANDKATWDRAELNLPIRQHDVVATDNGRAEVEFENGAMAFLNENSVLEFFDLSLDDGSLTTRLVLRQGTASFYVNPARADYFSVTGGDFTTEATARTNFRMDNFDDGSTVAVTKGRVSVVHKDDSTILVKGQSLTMHAGDEQSVVVGRAADSDDFDRWVSGREDSVVTATNAALQYSNSSSYVSGFGDLYTYGGFYPISGFGYGWHPYGVGIGWSPFDYGNWFYQPGLGWSFIGNQPWGWLPYHYGGWMFEPGIGWLWAPSGFGRGFNPVKFHPVTAAFVRSGNTVGIVPSHPLDNHGKTINLVQGVMPLTSKGGLGQAALATGTGKWKVVKEPSAATLTSHASPTTVPARVSRSVITSNATARDASQPAGSSITYDAKDHRFVNSNVPANGGAKASAPTSGRASSGESAARIANPATAGASARVSTPGRETRNVSPLSASARTVAPPPAPRAAMTSRVESSGGASASRGASMQMGTSTAPRSSAPTPRASSGSGSGRPH